MRRGACMSSRLAAPRKNSFANANGQEGDSTNPFHTDRARATYEHKSLFEWSGATAAAGVYESTVSTRLQSKNSGDVVIAVLHGGVQSHEGEFNGRGFRYGAKRAGQVSVFPLAATMDFDIAHSRVETCELYFPPRFAKEQLGVRGEGALQLRLAKSDPFLFHAANRLVGLGQRHDDVSVMQKEGLFRALALHLFATYGERPAMFKPAAREFSAMRSRQLRSYIEDELHRRIHCSELAVVAGCDLREFADVFRNTFKTTPAQYVIDRRLDRAEQLISDTTLDLADIAFSTGFSAQSHLTTALRKRRGITPYQLRKRSICVFTMGPERRKADSA